MRIGIYGGSFNPPHIGHLYIAEEVKRILRLDEVIMIPAGDPYLKDPSTIANKYDRLAMTNLLINESINDISCSEIEVERNGPSYTIDTLKQYKDNDPTSDFYIIVGSDSFDNMGNWKDKEEIIKNSTIVVVGRKENPLIGFDRKGMYASPWYSWWNDYKDKIMFLDIQKIDVSSTMIRNNIKEGKCWKYLTTENVANYIERYNLYKE